MRSIRAACAAGLAKDDRLLEATQRRQQAERHQQRRWAHPHVELAKFTSCRELDRTRRTLTEFDVCWRARSQYRGGSNVQSIRKAFDGLGCIAAEHERV